MPRGLSPIIPIRRIIIRRSVTDQKGLRYKLEFNIIADNNLSKKIVMSIYKHNEEIYNQLNELIYEDSFISLIFNNHTKVKINKNNYTKDLIKFYSFINQIVNTENINIYEYIDLSISNQIIVKERKRKIIKIS